MKLTGWILSVALVAALAWFFFARSNTPSAPGEPDTKIETAAIEPPVSAIGPKSLVSHVEANPAPIPDPAPPEATPRAGETRQVEPRGVVEDDSKPMPAGVVLKDERGNLRKASQRSAIQACSQLGMHLPTIRDWAKFGKARGAKGIVEVDRVREQDKLDGAVMITATNSDGRKDDFYYNPSGYVSKPDEGREQPYWSSSLCIGCVVGGSRSGGDSSYSFYSNGEIHDHYDTLGFAIRCLPGR
jgi:hypothetical protein